MFKGDYPDRWSDYVGQETAKRELRLTVKSAIARAEPMPHLLISSPYPGVGKSTLAIMTMRTYGHPIHVYGGPMKLNDVMLMFDEVKPLDVVFIDEFHRLKEGGAKFGWLLSYMTEGTLNTPLGAEEVPPITIVGATTEFGDIPKPIQDRFKVVELERYNDSEGALIAKEMAKKALVKHGLPMISDGTAVAVAMAGFNQPRQMRHLLDSIRDLALCEEIPVPDNGDYDLTEPLAFSRLTEDGLTHQAQQYLILLYKSMRSSTAMGERTIRSRLGVVGNGLHQIEQLLLDKDLIATTGQGRMLTSDGRKRAKLLVSEDEAA